MNELLAPAVDLVREFHREMGLPIALSFGEPISYAQLKKLGNTVFEEALELRKAIKHDDVAEVIKELADVVYSALGVVVALDLSLDAAFSTMKIVRSAGPIDDGPLGGLLAAVRAVAGERGVQQATSMRLSPDALALAEEIIDHSLRLRKTLVRRRKGRVERRVAALLFDAFALAIATGVPLSEPFMHIHRNNMTKEPARTQRGVAQKPVKGPDFEKVDLSEFLFDDAEGAVHRPAEGEHRE